MVVYVFNLLRLSLSGFFVTQLQQVDSVQCVRQVAATSMVCFIFSVRDAFLQPYCMQRVAETQNEHWPVMVGKFRKNGSPSGMVTKKYSAPMVAPHEEQRGTAAAFSHHPRP